MMFATLLAYAFFHLQGVGFAKAMPNTRALVKEGYASFSYPAAHKSLQTWYRITGDLSSGVPLITLHGGPGGGYRTTNPFTNLTSTLHIPVVQYDQVGCGQSTHLQELASAGPEFWNDQLFVAELENLVSTLGIKTYDVLGYSWGGMVAARFASKRPQGLRKLILMSAPASSDLWTQSLAGLRTRLPKATQEVLNNGEANGATDSPEYQAAVAEFESKFLCRVTPTPDDIKATIATVKADPTVYLKMWGSSDWAATGTLQHWTVVDAVKNIAADTLVTNGEFDEAQDIAIQPFLDHIPRVKHVKYAGASHTAQYEQPGAVLAAISAFLA